MLSAQLLALLSAPPAQAVETVPLGPRWVMDRWTTEDGLPMDHINDLALGADGRLWLATFGGLIHFDGRDFEAVEVGPPPALPTPRVIHVARQPAAEALWLIFEDGRLQRRAPEGVTDFPSPGPSPRLVDGQEGLVLWAGESLFALTDQIHPLEGGDSSPWHEMGRFVAGPWRGVEGYTIYREDQEIVRLDEEIHDLLLQGEDLWIATRGQGLLRIRPRAVEVILPPDGVSSRTDQLWWEDTSGTLWARADRGPWWATDGSGRLLDPPGLDEPPPGEPSTPTSALPFSFDERGRWWASQGRLVREAPATRALEPVQGGPGFYEAHVAWRAPDGAWWLGATGGVWRASGGRWVQLGGDEMGPPTDARGFAALPTGEVLIAAVEGLSWLSADGARAVPARIDEHPAVRHIRVNGERVWIATEERGLCVFEITALPRALIDDRPWRCLGAAEGLGSPGVHTSAPDARGRIWMSANRGLGVASAAQLDAFARGERDDAPVRWLGVRDGMRSSEANGAVGRAVVARPDGAICYPTQDGVACLHPDRAPEPEPPRVRVVEARVDGAAVPADALQLDADVEQVELRWGAVSFDWPEQVVFRHRLAPDGAWSEPDDQRRLSLRGLPPGERRLEIQARLGAQWGPVAGVSIARAPTLAERPVTWVFAALALVGLSLAGASARLRAARRRSQELEARVAAATSELETRAEELRALYQHSASQAERLGELDRVKRRLLANVSHELRTPLSLIIGPLGVLAEDLEPGPQREHLALALRNAERLRGLVGQLLQIAQAQSGALQLRARRGSLAARVARVLERFPAGGSALSFTPPDEEIEIWCDPEMFDTALGNLVSNALEHGGAGRVSVQIERAAPRGLAAPCARISVQDDGPGVLTDQRERIFERFHQADPGRPTGMGLGLALARELVELHGGEIGVDAPADGGSIFWFTLPLGVGHLGLDDVQPDAPDAPAPEPAPDPAEARGPRVLLVEDNSELRAFLASHMRARFDVTDVPTAEAGLAALEAGSHALLVSDVMLPGMSGLELVARTRERDQPIPALLISAKGAVEDRVDGLAVADDYLAKPFQVRELLARCDALLRRPSAEVVGEAEPAGPADAEPPLPVAAATFLRDLEAFADANLGEPALNLDAMARALGISRRSLHDRVQALGLPPPATWLRERRLDFAEDLLRRGVYETVGEVAAAVGMSRAYFSRAFKARTGRSPGSVNRRLKPGS